MHALLGVNTQAGIEGDRDLFALVSLQRAGRRHDGMVGAPGRKRYPRCRRMHPVGTPGAWNLPLPRQPIPVEGCMRHALAVLGLALAACGSTGDPAGPGGDPPGGNPPDPSPAGPLPSIGGCQFNTVRTGSGLQVSSSAMWDLTTNHTRRWAGPRPMRRDCRSCLDCSSTKKSRPTGSITRSGSPFPRCAAPTPRPRVTAASTPTMPCPPTARGYGSGQASHSTTTAATRSSSSRP